MAILDREPRRVRRDHHPAPPCIATGMGTKKTTNILKKSSAHA